MCERVKDPRAALAAAIDALLTVDPHALDDDALHDLAVELAAEESRYAAVRARVLAAWEARRAWADDGSRSSASRLARACGLSGTTARRELGRARRLSRMPATATALAEGKLSVDKADMLASVNQSAVEDLFARDESLLVEEAKGLSFWQTVQAARYWLACAQDEAGIEPDDRDGRYLQAVRTLNGTVDLRGLLDPVGGTEFLAELERLSAEAFEAEWAAAKTTHGDHTVASLLTRSAGQRRADALVAMARRSAATTPDAQRPRPLITVLCGYDAFARVCELAAGTVLHPGQVVPLLAGADIERIVFDGPSRVLDVGVRRRFFSGATRRAIEVRDRHCTHPSGCEVPAEACDIDHIVPPNQGGLTVQGNGRCLCGFHNRLRPGAQRRRPPPNDSG